MSEQIPKKPLTKREEIELLKAQLKVLDAQREEIAKKLRLLIYSRD